MAALARPPIPPIPPTVPAALPGPPPVPATPPVPAALPTDPCAAMFPPFASFPGDLPANLPDSGLFMLSAAEALLPGRPNSEDPKSPLSEFILPGDCADVAGEFASVSAESAANPLFRYMDPESSSSQSGLILGNRRSIFWRSSKLGLFLPARICEIPAGLISSKSAS